MAKTTRTRKPAGTPTALNLSVLRRYLAQGDGLRFPNAIESVSYPHIRRCLNAGYIAIDTADLVGQRGYLRVTATGAAALAADSARTVERVRQFRAPEQRYLDEAAADAARVAAVAS